MKLKEFLKQERSKTDMSQADVAERLGVSKAAVGHWESGFTKPTFINLLALCRLYNVDFKDVLDGTTGLTVLTVEDDREIRLLTAWRAQSPETQALLLNIIENQKPAPRKRGRPKG